MLKIGLTGGIGSGKSTVAKIFEILQIPVYYADDAAREIMNTDASLKCRIIEAFGSDTYKNDLLDRPYLSSLVFNNPEKLALLNSLVHPAIITASENWMLQQTGPYAIKEAALIFESGSARELDYVIGVYTPRTVRVQRIMHRDKISREQVLDRMKSQISEEIKMRLCDFVIQNNEEVLLIPQVIEIDRQLRNLAKEKNN